MSERTRNFFKLQKPYGTLKKPEEFFEIIKVSDGTVKSFIYQPDELKGLVNDFPRKIENIEFVNVSFTRTHIDSIDFYNCVFQKCLFINCRIENCEFHECKFIDTNTHKIDFKRVYIKPESFKNCLNPATDQNIGVHLYQRLMYNYGTENQSEFGRQASFHFNTWKRRYSFYELKKGWRSIPKHFIYPLCSFAFHLIWGLCGAGVYLARFMGFFAFILLIVSIINFCFRDYFGLSDINDFFDSLYFTMITVTTIGYGDITPISTLGKIIVAFEGFIGFFLFALAASIILRRIWP